MLTITNATKANVIAVVNAFLGLLVAYGVDLTKEQTASITILVNALLVLWIGLTFDRSRKRISDV